MIFTINRGAFLMAALFSIGMSYAMDSNFLEMKPIKHWEDAKFFADNIVAYTTLHYLMNKDGYVIDSKSSTLYGYVQSRCSANMPFGKDEKSYGLLLIRLLKKEGTSGWFCMKNNLLGNDKIFMRNATSHEAAVMFQAIQSGNAKFDYNDQDAFCALDKFRNK